MLSFACSESVPLLLTRAPRFPVGTPLSLADPHLCPDVVNPVIPTTWPQTLVQGDEHLSNDSPL